MKKRTGEMLPLIKRECVRGHVIQATAKATVCRDCGAALT